MENVTIWHNPRCSKSRNAAALLEENGIDAEIVRYLDTPPSKEELAAVLKMLGITARELMRTKEEIYKTLNLAEENNEDRLMAAMIENPKLIERPIVIKDAKAVIGRPVENIIDLLN